jgi:hypothetical protein
MPRRMTFLTAAAVALAAAGCEIVDHGGDLPPAGAYADSRYHDPWHGLKSPLLDEDIRRDMAR